METMAATESTETPVVDVVQADAPAIEEAAPAAFDPASLPVEAKNYFEKQYSEKYKDYEESKRAAQELQMIRNDPAFNEWLVSRNAPKNSPYEISDEQFVAALSDKQKFAQLVDDLATNKLRNEVAPQLQRTQQQFQFQAKVQELREAYSKFPDFKDLDSRGLVKPIVEKYSNISFEDAYWIAKKHTFNEEVDRRARGVVQGKKSAGVERGSNVPGARTQKVSVGSRLEAMELVAEALRAGRPAPEFDHIGDG